MYRKFLKQDPNNWKWLIAIHVVLYTILFNFNDRFIMNRITNIIEVECENFNLDVKYWWMKGNAGDYYNPPTTR